MKHLSSIKLNEIAVIYFDELKYTTKIISVYGVLYTSTVSITETLDYLCIKSGCTLKGRVTAFRELVGIKQKPAILLSESERIILLPTKSLSNPDCYLINYSRLDNVKQVDYFTSKLTFDNGFEYPVEVDRRVIKRQCLRCKEFLNLLDTDSIDIDEDDDSAELKAQKHETYYFNKKKKK